MEKKNSAAEKLSTYIIISLSSFFTFFFFLFHFSKFISHTFLSVQLFPFPYNFNHPVIYNRDIHSFKNGKEAFRLNLSLRVLNLFVGKPVSFFFHYRGEPIDINLMLDESYINELWGSFNRWTAVLIISREWWD